MPQSNERAARRKAALTQGAGKQGMNWTDKENEGRRQSLDLTLRTTELSRAGACEGTLLSSP